MKIGVVRLWKPDPPLVALLSSKLVVLKINEDFQKVKSLACVRN